MSSRVFCPLCDVPMVPEEDAQIFRCPSCGIEVSVFWADGRAAAEGADTEGGSMEQDTEPEKGGAVGSDAHQPEGADAQRGCLVDSIRDFGGFVAGHADSLLDIPPGFAGTISICADIGADGFMAVNLTRRPAPDHQRP